MRDSTFTAIFILFIAIIIGVIVVSVYGLVLAFKASIILGILALIIEPSPFVFGVVAMFGINIPKIIQAWIGFPI